jgi:hypothetical protein
LSTEKNIIFIGVIINPPLISFSNIGIKTLIRHLYITIKTDIMKLHTNHGNHGPSVKGKSERPPKKFPSVALEYRRHAQ